MTPLTPNDPHIHRGCREDCTKRVFAGAAFAMEMKRREEEEE